jgi:hypothetical protein
MQCNRLKLLGLSATLFIMEPVIALQVEKKVPTLGDVAETLIVGTTFLTRLALAGCIAIGITLVISSFIYFRAHRQNPKFAPLDRPIFLLLFGVILLAIPFLGQIFGPTASIFDLKELEATKAQVAAPIIDIDAPLEFGNEYDH